MLAIFMQPALNDLFSEGHNSRVHVLILSLRAQTVPEGAVGNARDFVDGEISEAK